MDIDYIRSSSYNNWDFCQMQYYLTYVLGIQKPTPKSADKGTVVHKVMESLALLNKNKKMFGKYSLNDDVCGNLEFSDEEWNKETRLSNTEVIIINNERSNPYTYKSSCKIQYPSTRVGVEVIKTLFDLSYNYYSSRSPVKWNETDRKDCWNWTWIPLEYKDGMFDPRKLNIVDAEPHFDLDVGQFSIKGTIDLVTSPNDESIEIVDWKTGQRKNWATGKRKDYAALCNDFQLMLYFYAAKRLYPQYKYFSVTIFFIRDGGPFTVSFDDEHVSVVEEKLNARYKEILNSSQPMMCDPTQSDVKCEKFCEFFKMKGDDGTNLCRFLHDKIATEGIDAVTEKYKRESHSTKNYKAPGE